MSQIRLGSTGILTGRNGFGALPIQRVDMQTAARILRKAYDGGITFFDTARGYTDSEEKIGAALGDVRENIFLATKTMSKTPDQFWEHLETSLKLLHTDYVDLYQFHNPPQVFRPGDGSGMYEAMLSAKEQGMVRHIGITQHQLGLAHEAVDSGLYETLQFPFSHLSGEPDLALCEKVRAADMGFIAMKALSGGLINNSSAAYGFFTRFDHMLPIWGIQHEWELDEFLEHDRNPPDPAAIEAVIEADRAELVGNFCRGCDYCQPCPQGIDIQLVIRAVLFLRRQPEGSRFLQPLPEKMETAAACTECGVCMSRCPYGLQIPALIRQSRKDYREYTAASPVG